MNLKRIYDSNRDTEWAFLMVRYQMPALIKSLQEKIPEGDLYVDPLDKINGYGFETNCHVTLFPCLDNDTRLTEIIPHLKDVSELQVKLTNISLFQLKDYDVLKADVEPNSILHSLNSELSKHFVCHSEFKDYHPHMTIAYLKKGSESSLNLTKSLDKPVVCTPECYEYSFYIDHEMKKCLFNI